MPDGNQVKLYQGSYALVIGASNYQDNAWGDLSSVGEDVSAVRQALEGQGFQVQTVMDPTEDDLIDEINDFIDAHGYEQDNRLLFYYAGHGYTQERNGRKFGYLVPVDAPNPYDNERAFFRKSLKMEQILSWAKQIESKHALFVFDSCFSGSVLQSRAVTIPEDISYSTAKPVRQFLSAGSANQTVPADSIFRPLFIRGIEGKADLDQDGYVTGVELGMFLQKQVPRYQTGQTPQYGKILDPYLDEGNFVFEVKRQSPKPKRQAAPPAVASVELGDLQEQADDAEKTRLEQQRLELARLEEQRLEQARQEQQKLEQARLEQQQVQQQWKNWQQKMQQDYDKVTAFEQQAIESKLKVQSWERFLSNWKDDNPYSQQDGELRSMAESRVTHWQQAPQEMTLYFDWDVFMKARSLSTLSKSENWKTTRTSDEDPVYVGEVQDGLPNGQGTYTFPDGAKYVGEWQDGKRNGQGTMTLPNGAKYVGEYKDDKKNGQGTITLPNGAKYVGEYKDDKRHGQGTFTWPNGAKYVGEFRDGNRHGQGTMTLPSGAKYVGEFKDDK